MQRMTLPILRAILVLANRGTTVTIAPGSLKTRPARSRSKRKTSSGRHIECSFPTKRLRRQTFSSNRQLATGTATEARAIKSPSSRLTLERRCRARSQLKRPPRLTPSARRILRSGRNQPLEEASLQNAPTSREADLHKEVQLGSTRGSTVHKLPALCTLLSACAL